jgi:hypothetical protein
MLTDLKAKSISASDINLLLRSHAPLASVDSYTRQDLLQAFEQHFNDAKEKAKFIQTNNHSRSNFRQQNDFG